jgi:hypothetical protein
VLIAFVVVAGTDGRDVKVGTSTSGSVGFAPSPVVGSLQPNQPGVSQVVVEVVFVTVFEVDVDVVVVVVVVVLLPLVVDSSKHPHQPGVLHVVVLVVIDFVVVDVVSHIEDDEIGSE